MLLWAARAALGNDDGSAMATLPARPQRPGGCSVAPPAAKRRLGALLSCVGVGGYEGRAMGLRKGEGVQGWSGEAVLMGVAEAVLR